MHINDNDKLFLSKDFPKLQILRDPIIQIKGGIKIKGQLDFIAEFKKKSREYRLYRNMPNFQSKYLLRDCYEIEMDISSDKNPYREVKEIGGKIERVAESKKINPCNLHIYVGEQISAENKNKVCLAGYLDEIPDISLEEFIGRFVVPFFYDQSFYAKYNKWPMGQYSHGCLGVLENYYDLVNKHGDSEENTAKCLNILSELKRNKQDVEGVNNIKRLLNKKKIKSHWNCVGAECYNYKFRKPDPRFSKSSRFYRNPKTSNFQLCHPIALKGLKRLHRDVKKFGLKNKITL